MHQDTNPDAGQIAHHFALGRPERLTGPHARGFQGEVWQLQTDAGTWAVKRSFELQHEADVSPGAEFQEAARAAGVPTPRIVRSLDGDVLAQLAFGQVRVDEWVDLADADPHIEPASIGATIASVHRVDGQPTDEFDEWYHQGFGGDRWIELAGQLATARAPFAALLGAQLDELVALETLVVAPARLQRCHRDMWADNVRRGADGRVWVIDWQDCGAADPSFELAALLFEYAYDDAARARSLYDAYLTAGGPGRVAAPQDFSMAVAQLGHILEISCSRWLTSADDDERALNEGRVAEFIVKPLSRRLIDGIIASCANVCP